LVARADRCQYDGCNQADSQPQTCSGTAHLTEVSHGPDARLTNRRSGNPPLMRVHLESDALSSVGRAGHHVALGALIGGNLFARFAMHPAVREVRDPRERGKLVNAAWRRYGVVNSLSLFTLAVAYAPARVGEARRDLLSKREHRIIRAKDVAMASVFATGIASGLQGIRFARMEPGGAVPLADGSTASPEASVRAASTKRTLNMLGAANLVSAIGLAAADATLAQASHRRPPLRRVFKRRY
jgi:hypothetical protein